MTTILADRGGTRVRGLVDTWLRSPQYSMLARVYWRFGVGWRRGSATSCCRWPGPTGARPVMVHDAARRFGRTLVSIRKKGPCTGVARIPNWDGQHLMYDWASRRSTSRCTSTTPSGPSSRTAATLDGLAPPPRRLRARTMGGDHHSCLVSPNREVLTSAVVADLAAPATIRSSDMDELQLFDEVAETLELLPPDFDDVQMRSSAVGIKVWFGGRIPAASTTGPGPEGSVTCRGHGVGHRGGLPRRAPQPGRQ